MCVSICEGGVCVSIYSSCKVSASQSSWVSLNAVWHPLPFVSRQPAVNKEFPREFHLWLRHVVTRPILLHLYTNLVTNLSQQLLLRHGDRQVPPSLFLMGRGKWNHGDNQPGCGSKTELTTQRPAHSTTFIQMAKNTILCSYLLLKGENGSGAHTVAYGFSCVRKQASASLTVV